MLEIYDFLVENNLVIAHRHRQFYMPLSDSMLQPLVQPSVSANYEDSKKYSFQQLTKI